MHLDCKSEQTKSPQGTKKISNMIFAAAANFVHQIVPQPVAKIHFRKNLLFIPQILGYFYFASQLEEQLLHKADTVFNLFIDLPIMLPF